MRAYDIALFLHMLGLITLFSGFAVNVRAGTRLRGATTVVEVRSWLGLLGATGPMFPAGLGLLLLTGLFMTWHTWRTLHPWIAVPLAGAILLAAVGRGVVERRLRAIGASAAGASDPIPDELAGMIAEPSTWTVLSALYGAALGIVWVMTTKPGWAGSLAAFAVGALAGGVWGFAAARPRGERALSPDAR